MVNYATITGPISVGAGPIGRRGTIYAIPNVTPAMVTIAAESYTHEGAIVATTNIAGAFSLKIPLNTDQDGAGQLTWTFYWQPEGAIPALAEVLGRRTKPRKIVTARVTASVTWATLIQNAIELNAVTPDLEATIAANAAAVLGVVATSAGVMAAVDADTGSTFRAQQDARLSATFAARQEHYDVIVIGGTEVGVLSAIAAARQGCSVLLVSQNERIGGNVGYALTKMDIITSSSPYTLTGITREFFSRCARLNIADREFGRWYRTGGPVKPSWAKRVFAEMIAAEKNITVLRSQTLDSVTKTGTKITSVTISGVGFTGTVVVDATPTGDVTQKSGCDYVIGRDGNTAYSESSAGVTTLGNVGNGGVDPYVTPGNPASGLLFGVSPRALGSTTAADPGVMTFGWRHYVTSVAGEKQAWPAVAPPRYDATKYELMARMWASQAAYYNATDGTYTSAVYTAFSRSFTMYAIDGGDSITAASLHGDLNSLGYLSSNYPNAEECLEYVTATPARRAQIEQNARDYVDGLWYFITQSGDARVPANLKTAILSYGLSTIELPEYGGKNPQFYVREGARLVGDTVLKESDLTVGATVADRIAWWCYDFDGHPVRVVASSGAAKYEGTVSQTATRTQYGSPVTMKVLFPKAAQCTNLLVPGQPSVSRKVYLGLRAVPTMMVLGEAAGYIAAETVRTGVNVQAVNVARVQAMQNLSLVAHAYAAASAAGNGSDYNTGANMAVTEGGAGTAFANVVTGLRFGPQLGLANLQSVAAGTVRHKRFTPNIYRPDRYRVVHIYSPTDSVDTVGIRRATNVQYTISHADGVTTRTMSQQWPPGAGFDVLGEFYFDYGTPSANYIEINTSGATTDGLVVAGIIALFPVGDVTEEVNGA